MGKNIYKYSQRYYNINTDYIPHYTDTAIQGICTFARKRVRKVLKIHFKLISRFKFTAPVKLN